MKQKQAFSSIFIFLIISLLLVPFILTFNDVITKIVEHFVLYTLLQDKILPIQVKVVGFIVREMGIDYIPYADGMRINGYKIYMTWNCLGWQSLILFFLSLVVSLWGTGYTNFSKTQTIILGLIGIFWINIFRLSIIMVLAAYAMPLYRLVFHDYLAAFMSIGYLFVFWWFAYSFILEKNSGDY